MPEIITKHLTSEELEVAIEAKTAKVVFSKPGWRLVVHDGLKYSCVSSSVSLWAVPAGSRDSDYRGSKTVWSIKKVEIDAGYERKKPGKAIDVNVLIPKLKEAISFTVNERWSQSDWPLLKPENIKVLIEEIERMRPAKAA